MFIEAEGKPKTRAPEERQCYKRRFESAIFRSSGAAKTLRSPPTISSRPAGAGDYFVKAEHRITLLQFSAADHTTYLIVQLIFVIVLDNQQAIIRYQTRRMGAEGFEN